MTLLLELVYLQYKFQINLGRVGIVIVSFYYQNE